MDGFKAYKYYMALKLHFTSPKYNVFKTKGNVRGSMDKFMSRNDRFIFEKMAREFRDDKDYIQFIASNFMYGNPDVVYDRDGAMSNYKEYLKRRQSITRVFQDDLHTIVESGAEYNLSGNKIPDVIQLYMAGKITLETLVILDSLDSLIERMKQDSHLSLLLGDEFTRIEKSKGFVKFDSEKIKSRYSNFLEEVKQHHG